MRTKHKTTLFKRLGAWVLTLALVVGLLPQTAFAAGTDTGKAIQFVDSGTAANISGAQADNIYFGTYQQSSDGNSGYNIDPIKWRVLENADGQLFLLSDQNLDVFQYHVDYESVTWATSTMRSWLNGYGAAQNTGSDNGIDYTDDNFIDTAFSDGEQGAIVDTTVVNDDNPDYNTEGGENTNDKIFLLSIAEAQNSSYFADDNSRIATNTAYVADGGKIDAYMNGVGEADYWWLRSPGDYDDGAAIVAFYGGVYSDGKYVDDNIYAVRPAFNLDLNSVLFTSAAVGGKSASGMDSGLTAVGDYDGSEWKLTLLDEARNSFEISNATITDTITFSYSGAATGTNEYISAVVVDNGAITHYGRILQPGSTSGTASFTIPDGVTLSDTVKLYVFNEQYNSDKMTDYASQLKEISSSTDDTTDPTLSNGSATRDSETTATVKFTSDEAGEYYYAVVESGDTAPTIDTTGTGTACDTTEQTISLNNLSGAGAKDIYIVAKDAAGNVSQQLKITIPAYIAPSYGISASPAALDFGSETEGYADAPAAQIVTITNIGNQSVTVNLPTSAKYIITAGTGFENGTATLASDGTATFTVQPNTGLAVGSHSETLNISGSDGTSASVKLSFTVAFATESDKAIMLGTEHLQGGQADNIYFGTYQQSSDGSGGYNTDPIKWRVLENANGQLFLLSDQNLDVFQYHTEEEDVTWETSTMRSWLNGYSAEQNTGGSSGTDYTSDNFIGAAFSEKEQKAIAETEVVNDDNPTYGTEGGDNTNDKIFLLSIAEANNDSYFADNNSRIATNTAYVAGGGKIGGGMLGVGAADYWWLRSPGDCDDLAAYVYDYGGVNSHGSIVYNDTYAVRPAFNLDLNSVLFTSAAVGGKSATGMDRGLTAVNGYSDNEWKLTLLDEAHNSFEISNATITDSGDTIDFSYSGAATGTNEYISAVVVDNGAITHYGRILQPGSTSGTASFTIPDGVTLSDTVKLYVFNEQYNSDKMTDYASQLKEISSSTDDTTAPTLTAGTATRDSETTATVKFTSSEAGSYYYEVVNSGENQPTIDTDGTGTTCGTTEQTISLTNLSDTSAKDIYIVVKDAAGNVSQPLTIQIPAYTFNTFTVTVNVDPSEGGTASADPPVAAEGTEVELSASPSTGYHFKGWQVTEGTVSIGVDNKFTMPAEDVTVKAVFEAHSLTAHDYKAPTCTETGNIQYWECSVCKQLFSDVQGTTETTIADVTLAVTEHTAGADWKYNDSTHWKLCVNCSAKVDETAHVYDDEKDITCNDCGYERTIEGGDEPEPGHTADGSGWHRDENGHWQLCACGEHLDAAAHTFAWVTDKPATAAEAGSRHEQCTVCGYRKAAESIPPLAPEPDRGTDEHPEIGDAIADGTWGKTESAPADGETNTEKTVPATGDSSQPVLWIGLLAASGLGIAALLVLRRRKRQ